MDEKKNEAAPQGESGEKEKLTFSQNVLEWAEELFLAAVVFSLIFTFVVRTIYVDGDSMVGNYNDGDQLLTTGLVPKLEQGDVVVIINVLDDTIIKRVIATEGQTVDFDYSRGQVIVDGQVLDEEQFGLPNGITTEPPYSSTYGVLEFPQTVPEGCVFCLGDNRNVSKDSRYSEVGMIDTRNILGKAVLRFYPFDEFGLAR